MSRPRSDRLALVERVADVLDEEPELTANDVIRRIRGRRSDVLRAVRVLRTPPQPTVTIPTQLLRTLPTSSVSRFLRAAKETCGCIDCGRRDGVLHFDHRSGAVKAFDPWAAPTISHAVLEIEECDVRCAPCHGYRHARAA